MVAGIIITILALLHILAAMGWMGGAVLFVSVLIPGLRGLSPTASLEFLAKVGPRSTRFFIGSSTATIIFGLALLFTLPGLTNAIYVGAGLGLIAYLIAIGVAVPSFLKADHMAQQMLAAPQSGPPPPEFQKILKRGGIAVTAVVVILLLAIVFMVYSGFPF